MRVPYKELMDTLGVGYELAAYETCPWSVYSDEKQATCSAEVRNGPDGDDIDVELQVLYDVPPEGKSHLDQVFCAKFKPAAGTPDKWDCSMMKIEGKGNEKEMYNWEEKGCTFFNACVQELKMGNFPDIEELLETHVRSSERFGDRYGGGGGKSPKIKPQQLLGLKGGRGF